jgi:hypothetical protein
MIHIHRRDAFGDVLWIEPVVRYFLQQDQKVNVLTPYYEIFENYPSPHLSLNEMFSYSPGDRIINLNMSYEKNRRMHFLKAFCISAKVPKMELSYPRLYLSDEEYKPLISGEYAILHIEKKKCNFRNVYGIEWEKVVNHIKSLKIKVVQISHSGVNIYGEWLHMENWRQIMSLIFHAKYFIGIDSGPSHIAAAFGIPALLFFGSVNPAYRHLKMFNGIILQGVCPHPHCYHEAIHGKTCKIVGDDGVPPCCRQTTEKLLEALHDLMATRDGRQVISPKNSIHSFLGDNQ